MSVIIIIIQILVMVCLLTLSGLFSGSETAYTSLDGLTLSRLIRDKKLKEADRKYWKKSFSMIPALLVGNNIVNIAATAVATSFTIHFAQRTKAISENAALLISTTIFSVLLIFFGEVLPKTFVRIHKEKAIYYLLNFMKVSYVVFKPVTKIIAHFTSFVINLFPGVNTTKTSVLSSVDDITMIIHLGHKEGLIKDSTRDLLTGVIEFPSKTVLDIMIPRVDINCVDSETKILDVLMLSDSTGHTRLPVYEETIDNIIGILNTKNIIKDYINGKHQKKAIDYIMLPYFVPEDKALNELFREMQSQKIQMAIVIDEYGGTSGIVSTEDILEEIVGNIEDEMDKNENNIIFYDKKTLIKGATPIDEVNAALKLKLTPNSEKFQTIAGYVLDMLGKIPEQNEKFSISSYNVRVRKMDNRRIVELEFIHSRDDKEDVAENTAK